jgi:hypothetical protein
MSVDPGSRVSPAIEGGVSVTGERVVAVLEHRKRTSGRPDLFLIVFHTIAHLVDSKL